VIRVFCTDFIFDNERLSDHGFIICSFDGSELSWSGGDVSFTTIKLPDSDRQVFYKSNQETPLSATFGICKNPCRYPNQEDMYITQEEYSELYRWLQRTDGYHWLQFVQEDFEDIYYNSMINLEPYFISGKTCGFTITITTDSPYGYSKLIHRNFVLNDVNSCYVFQDYSDKPGSTYIKTIITPLSDGDLTIETGNNKYSQKTTIKNVVSKNPIILDGENSYFSGISSPYHFNFKFPVVVNTYNKRASNFKKINGVDCNIEIEYRYKRRVIV